MKVICRIEGVNLQTLRGLVTRAMQRRTEQMANFRIYVQALDTYHVFFGRNPMLWVEDIRRSRHSWGALASKSVNQKLACSLFPVLTISNLAPTDNHAFAALSSSCSWDGQSSRSETSSFVAARRRQLIIHSGTPRSATIGLSFLHK